jgi:hypothetical protein
MVDATKVDDPWEIARWIEEALEEYESLGGNR